MVNISKYDLLRIYKKNPNANQTAGTYLQSHNLKRQITKTKPCLPPVKGCLSGSTLREEVTISLLNGKL